MNKQGLIEKAAQFVETSPDNIITEQIALSEQVIGMKIFESPLFAFAAADDTYFKSLKDQAIIGEHFLLPEAWLPQAKTVISFFLPFTEVVKKSNRMEKLWPSHAWLHGRIEGQTFVNKLSHFLKSELIASGYRSIVPAMDERFWSRTGVKSGSEDSGTVAVQYTSNWSERHVAYVCGLGTFSLSKGLITKKGMAGRLGSIVTELYIAPDQREYQSFTEYCTTCGACVRNCPANAITLETGKDHQLCSAFLDKTAAKYRPRYGCGKCQTKVPCESRIPRRP